MKQIVNSLAIIFLAWAANQIYESYKIVLPAWVYVASSSFVILGLLIYFWIDKKREDERKSLEEYKKGAFYQNLRKWM